MFSTIRYVLFLKLTSLYQMIRESLHNYIYNEIIPKYAVFDKAHHEDHALAVIDRALSMGRQYNINEEMLLTAAACHDLGLAIDRKTHHLESGRIIRTDSRLSEWFSPEQIEVIAQAAEDHRASSITPPRSIYGCLVAEADRVIDPEIIIRRTIQFSLSHYPQLDKEGHWQRFMQHMDEKYSVNGYIRLWIQGSENERKLNELRKLITAPDEMRQVFDKIFTEETA